MLLFFNFRLDRLNSWPPKWLICLWANVKAAMTSAVICGQWVSLPTSFSPAIHHFPAIARRNAAGIVARIAKDAKNCYLSPFVKVRLSLRNSLRDIFTTLSCLLSGRFSFPESEWRDVSDEAKDLISNLLVKEASKRLSAEAVLNHPWIKFADEQCGDVKRHRALRTPGIIRR